MTRHLFDDANLPWRSLDTIEHLHYWILDIDRQNKIVDVVFKFAANQQIVLHRHKVPNKTFVIQGEHRLYEADGRLKEIRPVGSYTSSLPSDEPHREGGADEDAIVFFSIRGNEDVFYEILDDDLNVIATLGIQDFIDLYAVQKR